MLDSEEAARHLGVKLATLYAYVSRGVLVSHPVPGTRRRRFAREDLDRLAARHRPSRPDDTRLATVVTGVTHIDEDGLRYRGRPLADLVGRHCFEEVATLLWWGAGGADLPYSLLWQGVELPDLAGTLPDADILRVAVVTAGALDPFRGDQREPAFLAATRRLIATVVDALPVRGGGRPAAELVVRGERRPGTIAQRLSAALCTRRASAPVVAAMDVALATMADHELATSTLAARVAASARADLYGVVLSGMGAMSGRLHAAASNEVRPLLDDARWQGPAEALGRVLRERPVPIGFGHRLYPAGDPRAQWILASVQRVAPSEQWKVIAELLAVAADQGVPPPNVDFALGALVWAGRMAPGAAETIATVARIAGWAAHALEEYEEIPLRFRARAVYRPDP